MKTILCYGDSNTHGFDPRDGKRYPADVRWPGVLRQLLGDEYTVIEEGCNGRTSILEDPVESWKNGLTSFRPCLVSHKPIDILIIMLGTNNLKRYFHASAAEIADSTSVLIDIARDFLTAQQGYAPEIILVSPPLVGPGIDNSPFSFAWGSDAIARSKDFAKEYKRVADSRSCLFFDSAPVATPSEEDSVHITPQAHKALAEGLYEVVKGIG